VAVLSASNFTFAEATRTQGGVDWITSPWELLEIHKSACFAAA
jgi:hypothetical protein